ncbi:MAG: ATP-dependent Clp protease proteolytic subunit [Cytophagales bacterium]|nr:ATP-dependent Clp protease proteolytic subunit [Cytophagales bacterium]
MDKDLSWQEFRKYVLGNGLGSGLQFDQYRHSVENMTRSVIEERPTHFREIDVFSRLIMDRIIFLGLEVDDVLCNIITAQLLFLESTNAQRPITLYINSPGGSVYAGLGIYDTMQYISPPISTVCTGLAASMAAILLCGGEKGRRASLPHARIMIHQPMSGMQGRASDMEISLRQTLTVKKDLYDILAEHTKKSYEEIEKDADRDFWMSAVEAQSYGLIDEVMLQRPSTEQEPNS